MPPKKQEEEPSAPIVVWSVLPIIFNSPLAFESLKKPVNIKKTLDKTKIIQLLKDKGIEKYINEGNLTRQGQLFLSENLQSTAQQFLAQSRKPADPKKDQKKDSKKDSKKEEVAVEQAEKPIEFDFKKGVTEFMFYLDIPCDLEALQKAMKGGLKPQIILWVQEQIKQGSQLPNYNLLNNDRTVDDFMSQINTTSAQKMKKSIVTEDFSAQKYQKKQVIRNIRQLRGKPNSQLQNTIIIQVPFQRDLQHPEKDAEQFLKKLFETICSLTLDKQKYDSWLKDQKVVTMVPTIKETIKKEVVVEEKKQDKKGGKKEVGPPVTEIVEQVIQRKYQSFPQNMKSDLTTYKRISHLRQTEGKNNIYFKFLDDLALSVSYSTEPLSKLPNLNQLGNTIWNRQHNKPGAKVSIQNVKDKLRQVIHSLSTQQLHYSLTFQPTSIPVQVSLYNIVQQNPGDASIEHQYRLHQFTQLSKMLGKRVFFTFEDRKYVQKLEPHIVNSLINQQMEFDPRVYYGKYAEDGYNLLILSRVNPPGRVLYKNSIFDWKVIPNFQFWQETVKNKQSQKYFLDYNWRKAGNLKMLSKRMMPTDNSVIIQNSCCFGDKQTRFVTVVKENIIYGLRQISPNKHIFWKHTDDLRTSVFTKQVKQAESNQKQEIKICIQKEQFVIQFSPYITINWLRNKLEQSRQFGPNGEITKRLTNGNVQILYANGDISLLSFGAWTHIKNNTIFQQNQEPKQLKKQYRVQTDKKIQLRQDFTVFITYSNGNRSVVFKDGTVIKRIGSKKIQILNPNNIIVRVILARDKDFNIIGAGSAFAYLGESNILERSYDGALYELYDHSFSWHSYTEGIDRQGIISLQKVMMIAYPDKSIIKIQNSNLTFLNKATQNSEQYLHERWIQLFTSPDYHREGVYDVDLTQGEIKTRDAESNFFNVKVNGTGKTTIAVSFNVGNNRQQKNQQKNGFDIPEQNFFLPAPENKTAPRLFAIYPDGSGEQYLTQDQISELKSWRAVNASSDNRNIIQYSKQVISSDDYLSHSFSQRISLQNFQLPNILSQKGAKPNLIKYNYNPVEFRSIESISWDPTFSKLTDIKDRIKQKRVSISKDLAALKTYQKA